VVAARTGTFYGKAMAAGDIYTVAGTGTNGFNGNGGLAASAELAGPEDVLIADNENFRVRVVAARTGTFYGRSMTAGDIYTVAGTGTEGYSGDGGQATNAEFTQVFGVAVDSAGDLLIADVLNNRIRMVNG
jgi:hypothetical protein